MGSPKLIVVPFWAISSPRSHHFACSVAAASMTARASSMEIPTFWSITRRSLRSSITTTNRLVSSSTFARYATGTSTGISLHSDPKKFASRIYMRNMVLVNTAASSSAGNFTTTEDGQFGPFSTHLYKALDTPMPAPICCTSIESTFQPNSLFSHATSTSPMTPGICAPTTTPFRKEYLYIGVSPKCPAPPPSTLNS